MLNYYLLLSISVETADLGILFLRILLVDSVGEELISMLSFAKSAVTTGKDVLLQQSTLEILKDKIVLKFLILLKQFLILPKNNITMHEATIFFSLNRKFINFIYLKQKKKQKFTRFTQNISFSF